MARKKTEGLTDREAEILSILWEHGEASAEEIRVHMQNKPTTATVRTLLAIMRTRGLVGNDGRDYAKKYHAKVERETAQVSALRRLIDTLFAGSAEEMLLRLRDSGEIDVERFKELYERSQARKNKK